MINLKDKFRIDLSYFIKKNKLINNELLYKLYLFKIKDIIEVFNENS